MIAFIAAIILMLVLAYVPGLAVLRSVGFSLFESAFLAPLLSTFAYVALGVLFYHVGIFTNWIMILMPIIAISLLAFALRFFIVGCAGFFGWDKSSELMLFGRKIDFRMLVAALVFNLLIASVVFLGTLDGRDSFSQNFDM